MDARGGERGTKQGEPTGPSEAFPGCVVSGVPSAFLCSDEGFLFQGKQKDGSPFGEYGGWYKACKVDRCVEPER